MMNVLDLYARHTGLRSAENTVLLFNKANISQCSQSTVEDLGLDDQDQTTLYRDAMMVSIHNLATREDNRFLVYRTMSLLDALSEYARQQEQPIGNLEFILNGSHIVGCSSPRSLGLSGSAKIYARLAIVNYTVCDESTGDCTDYIIKNASPVSDIFAAFAQRKAVCVSSLNFLCQGTLMMNNSLTPNDLLMADKAIIVVKSGLFTIKLNKES